MDTSGKNEIPHDGLQGGRFLRPIIACTAASLLGEFFILLFFGVWLFPSDALSGKILWTLGFCGLGMGLVLGAVIGIFVYGQYEGRTGIAATTILAVLLLGFGCNALCFIIDRHFNHFGATDQPFLWFGSGLLLSTVGGFSVGLQLFTARGQQILNHFRL